MEVAADAAGAIAGIQAIARATQDAAMTRVLGPMALR